MVPDGAMKTIAMKISASLMLTVSLAACAVIPDAPNVSGTPMPEGTPVALGQPVAVGTVVATPMKVVEDSRCPINARCVWAGRLVVETRIDGPGWRDTANINLGETYGTHGDVIELVGAQPDQVAGSEIDLRAYRFTYAQR